MIMPTKLTPIYKSYIYKGMVLLRRKTFMYDMNQDIFKSVSEYIDVMTILYAMGYIDEKGEIVDAIQTND